MGTRDNAVRLCHVGPARVSLRHAPPNPPQLPGSLHRLVKINRADHSISYRDTLMKTGSERIEATLRRRPILFAGFLGRMEDTKLPTCVMFGELVRGACCVGRPENEWLWCFLYDLRAFGINADQCTAAA